MSENLIALLEALADEGRSVPTMDLTELSDLARDQMATFRAAWDAFSPSRRLSVMAAMVEQAEANIHLNFHAILRTCLTDKDPQIRKLAIEGLWEDNKVNLVRPLIDLLNGDPAADVRAAAAVSLGRFVLLGALGEIADAPAQQAEGALQAAWERFAEPVAVRRRALESLACCGNPALHDMIHSAYYDESDLMRQSAVFAMGRSADARWARFVLVELHNQEPAMRFESATAAGEMGLREAVQPLIGRLDDPDGSVREAAATALGKIGGPAARRALLALLDSRDEALAQAAEDALDELSFGRQRLDAPSQVEVPGRTQPRRKRDDEDEFGDIGDDEPETRGDQPEDGDNDLVDWYEDEMYDDEDEFDPESDEDLLDWDEEGLDDEDDHLSWS